MKAVFICASVLLAACSVFGYIVNDKDGDKRRDLTKRLKNSCTHPAAPAVECTVEIPDDAYTNETRRSVPRGSLVEYACNNGYRAVGGDALRGCLATGQLGGRPLICLLAVECTVEVPANAYTNETRQSILVAQDLQYACNGGYRAVSGDAIRVCTEMGQLTGQPLNCVLAPAVECTVEVPANAYTIETRRSVPRGSVVAYACRIGYRAVDGDVLRACMATGQLGGEPLNCLLAPAVECTVEVPVNAYTTETRRSVPRGSLVPYACNNGYRAVDGDVLRACMATGQLGGQPLNCVLNCPKGWTLLPVTGRCYKYFDTQRNYTNAQAACAHEGGIISTAKSQAEHDLLMSLKNSNKTIYLGLDDNATEGEFRWNDGTLMDWDNWGPGEPKNFVNYDCAAMKYAGFWIDAPCSLTFPYVCKVAPTAFENYPRQQNLQQTPTGSTCGKKKSSG